MRDLEKNYMKNGNDKLMSQLVERIGLWANSMKIELMVHFFVSFFFGNLFLGVVALYLLWRINAITV